MPEVTGSYKDCMQNPVSASVFLKPTDLRELSFLAHGRGGLVETGEGSSKNID